MTTFRARSATFRGSVRVPAPPARAFPLFSPEGERDWVPGWDPEPLYPAGVAWAEGQIFRTREETGDGVWVVSRLEPDAHRARYHRVEPGRWVACVEVACRAADGGETEAEVAYTFVGLSEAGNDAIAAMTAEDYEAKMRRWRGWIDSHLAAGA